MTEAPGIVRRYREVSTIPDVQRLAADMALSHAVAELGIPAQRVRWFQAAAVHQLDIAFSVTMPNINAGIDGRSDPGEPETIWVRAWMGNADTVKVVLHECHHQASRLAGPPASPDEKQRREALASAYGESQPRLIADVVGAVGP